MTVWTDGKWKIDFSIYKGFGQYTLYETGLFRRKINFYENERLSLDLEIHVMNGLLIDEHLAGKRKFSSIRFGDIIK